MTATKKAILNTFGRAIPLLSDLDKERLLAFGEGVALMAERQKDEAEERARQAEQAKQPDTQTA